MQCEPRLGHGIRVPGSFLTVSSIKIHNAQHNLFPQVDVAGLLDDAWAIAEAGRGGITPFLNLTR